MGKKKSVIWDCTPVPPEKWGKSHLSTLVYIESRIVDGDGQPKAAHMRTKKGSLRRGDLSGPAGPGFDRDYPTILRDGTEVHDHDDWDCASDLVRFGYVEWNGTGLRPIFALTDSGWALAGRGRRHLGERPSGKRSWNGFEVTPIAAEKAS